MQKNLNYDFDKSIHRFGAWSSLVIYVMMMGIPILISYMCGYFPDFSALASPLTTLLILMLAAQACELVAFPPMFGPGALYMCYVTGNVTQLKIPSLLAALKATNIETGTQEASAIAMVSVGVSSITTMVIIALGLIFMLPLTPVLQSPELKPVFDNVVPALYGALLGVRILSSPKDSVISFVICIVGMHALNIPQSFMMLICMAIMIAKGKLSYDKTKKNKAE